MKKQFVVLIALGLLLGACSRTDRVTQPQVVNDVAWSEIHDDPAAVGEWLLRNPLADAELTELLARPTEFHASLVDHVLKLEGVQPTERASMVSEFTRDLAARSDTSSDSNRPLALASATASCDQPVEYRTLVYGTTYAYQVQSWNSGNGIEYTFYFWPSWTDTPDDMRWASTIGWVTYCIVARSWFSSGGIAGHHLCGRPYQLQLGDGVMKAIGFGFRDSGVRATYASLYMHHM